MGIFDSGYGMMNDVSPLMGDFMIQGGPFKGDGEQYQVQERGQGRRDKTPSSLERIVSIAWTIDFLVVIPEKWQSIKYEENHIEKE